MPDTRRFPVPAGLSQEQLLAMMEEIRVLRAQDGRLLGSVQDDGSWVLWWREEQVIDPLQVW